MMKFKKKIIILLILFKHIINIKQNENIICGQGSTRIKCNLISITLKKDFIFEFPILEENEKFEIVGNLSVIDCKSPCKKIIIKSPLNYKSEININLIKVDLKAQFIIIDIKGNLNLKNSLISSSNKSTKFSSNNENCLSLTGYCYFYDRDKKNKIFNPTSIESNNYSIYYFRDYLKDGNYERLNDFLGLGTIIDYHGGGQIIINVDNVFIDESSFESSFKWKDKEILNKKNIDNNLSKEVKKKIRLKKKYFKNKIRKEDEKKIEVAATGGYIFLNINKLEIKNDKSKFRVDVLGNCYKEEDNIIITSSSSGFILAKINKTFEVKDKEKNEIILDDLLDNLYANNNCYTSSTGFIYLENEEHNILASIYDTKKNNEKKTKELINGKIEFTKNIKKTFFSHMINSNTKNINKKLIKNFLSNNNIKNDTQVENTNMVNFKLPVDFIFYKIYIKNVSMDIHFNTENNLNLVIKKLEINNSNQTVLSVLSSKYITFNEISLTNTVLKIFNILLILKKILNLYISSLQINRFFSNEADINLENSLINNYIDLNSEMISRPDDFDNLKNFDYIKNNFEKIKEYNFISINNSKKVSLITNSKIIFPIILLDSVKLEIQNNSKLISQFYKKAIVKSQNMACGYAGENNAGLGFFNFKTKNNFCIRDWIIKNKLVIERNENLKINFSSTPIFISKKDFIKDNVFVNIGGYIEMKGNDFFLEGSILAKGEDSSNIENIYIGSTAGGNISLEFEKYQIVEKSVLSISGGKGNNPLGPSGGGKIFIYYKPPDDELNEKRNEEYDKNFLDKFKLNINSFFFEKKNKKEEDKKTYDKLQPEFFDLGENSFESKNSYDFPNPIYSFYNQNRNLFLGKIYNKYECKPGYYSNLCLQCPFNKFKPFFGHGNCIECPCEIEKSIFYKPIIKAIDCPCKKKPFIQTYFLIILLLLGLFAGFIIYTYQMIKISKIENDFRLLLSIQDISNLKHRIICNGSNIAENPFHLDKNDFFFITNAKIFCKKFNKLCLYNNFEKIILNIFYFLNFSPLFFLIQSAMKMGKVQKIKYLLKNFLFLSNDSSVYIIKYTLSANASNFSIIFLNDLERLDSHQFSIKFPYKIPIIGMGLFHYEFKLDLKGPVNMLIIKNLKRTIKNQDFKLNDIIPGQLINRKNDKKIHTLDYLLSYLNVLLATLQIDIPKKKLIVRIMRFEVFLKNFNKYLEDYGFKIIFFINFALRKSYLHFNFFTIINISKENINKIIYILKENKKFAPKLYFEIIRKKRKKPISIIFPQIKQDKQKTQINKKSQNSQLSKKLSNLKSIKIPRIKKYKIIINKIRKITNRIFWTFFTYHNCIRKKLPYYFLKFIFLSILLAFKIYTSKSINIDEYIYIMVFYPSFIDEITIVLLILQIFINKKKLDKFIIYCSFLSFFKSLVISLIFICFFYPEYYYLSHFILLYFFYSFISLLLCYFNCYEISFELFDKTLLIIKKIN